MSGRDASLFGDYEGSRLEFLRTLVDQGEEPAFLRRSRQMQSALNCLDVQLKNRRIQYQRSPSQFLGTLAIRIHHDWSNVKAHLVDPSQSIRYEALYDELNVKRLRLFPAPTLWLARIPRMLKQLEAAVERFNGRWWRLLNRQELTSLNRQIADFNEFYPMEKSCAFGTEDIKRLGFTPLPYVTLEQLNEKYPPIRLPALRTRSWHGFRRELSPPPA